MSRWANWFQRFFAPLLLVALLLVVGFGVWCISLVVEVKEQRAEVEERVSWLSLLQRCQAELEGEAPNVCLSELQQVSASIQSTIPQELSSQLDAQMTEVLRGGSAESRRALSKMLAQVIVQIRRQTGALSAELGAKWDSLNYIAFVALFLASLNIFMLVLAQRRNYRLQVLSEKLASELSARQKSEAALVAAEEKMALLEHATGSLDVGVALVSSSKSLSYVGPSLRSLAAEWGDVARFWELLTQSQPIPEQTSCPRCGAPTRMGRLEARLQTPDGEPRVFSLVFTGHGHDVGHEQEDILLLQDLSDLEGLRAQLQQSERLTSLGMLAAGLAHEINNPLAYILLNLNCIEKGLPALLSGADKEQSEDILLEVKESLEGARRLQQIVADVRLFSRPQEDASEPVALARVLDAALNVAAPQIRKRATLEREIEAGLPQFRVNESRLGQVFLTLLLNAVRSLPEGHPKQDKISLRAFQEEERVIVEVSDTGEGIDPQNMARIFDPFFTTKSANIGTGLGLAISHRLIVSLGGELTVRSVLGKGSTFRVVLPASLIVRAEPRMTPTPTPETTVRAHILAIDDERPLLTILKKTLTEHEFTLAPNGIEALNILDDGDRFDLILCDLNMPEQNGEEFFEALSEKWPEYQEKVLFMSGGGFIPKSPTFASYLKSHLVEKPFLVKLLQRRIQEMVAPEGSV